MYEMLMYLRDKRRQKIGLVVAVPDEEYGIVRIGWAFCHSKKDRFTKERGLNVAKGRANKGTVGPIPLKDTDLILQVRNFIFRCKYYYKDKAVWVGPVHIINEFDLFNPDLDLPNESPQ